MEGGEIREEALNWWREALHNLRQAKKNFEIEEYSVAAFLCHHVEADEILDELKILNPHYTIARYPNAANTVPSEAYSREIVERGLGAACKVVDWARKIGGLP